MENLVTLINKYLKTHFLQSWDDSKIHEKNSVSGEHNCLNYIKQDALFCFCNWLATSGIWFQFWTQNSHNMHDIALEDLLSNNSFETTSRKNKNPFPL